MYTGSNADREEGSVFRQLRERSKGVELVWVLRETWALSDRLEERDSRQKEWPCKGPEV